MYTPSFVYFKFELLSAITKYIPYTWQSGKIVDSTEFISPLKGQSHDVTLLNFPFGKGQS